MEIPQPPVVVIPTDKPLVNAKLGRKNSVNVTLLIGKDETPKEDNCCTIRSIHCTLSQFDLPAQFRFRLDVAYAVTKYCIDSPKECG